MTAELELDDIEATYPGAAPVRALRPTSLRINRAEMVAVIGRSGSGKSTLLNILGLLDRPTEGRYYVQGIDTGQLPESQLTSLRASQFGFVFQAYHLLPDRTATVNAELGLLYRGTRASARRKAAINALVRVDLADRLNALPGTMSGGERQRVAIARALAQEPRVLLCDEPTGNLDRQNTAQILELLQDLNAHGLTVVIVTHDLELAASMPRVLQIDDGVVSDLPLPEMDRRQR